MKSIASTFNSPVENRNSFSVERFDISAKSLNSHLK